MPARKRRTQAERREEAETRLIQVALKLVAEKGYGGFTLADVGEAAGYSRGLPAHYFGRKEDLLSAVAKYVVDQYNRAVLQLPSTERGLPSIVGLVRQYVRGSNSKAARALGMLLAEAMIHRNLRGTIADLNARGLAGIEEEIRAGIDAGNIRSDVDVEHQARVIYAFLRGQMFFAALDRQFDAIAVGEEFVATIEARLGVTR